MPLHRTEVLLNHETASTATTKILDIKMTEIISRLTIQFKGTNNGSTATAHPDKMISKIELVNGSDVLFSGTAREAKALNILNHGNDEYKELNYIDNNSCVCLVHLYFGRFLYDKELALNPNKFKNLQLKITHNKASGGSAPDAGTLFISADVFDTQQPNPRGFIMAKEVVSYTLVASAHEYIDLPLDHPIRKMLVMSLTINLQPFQQYNKLKLTEDGGRNVIIDDQRVSDMLKYFPGNPYVQEKLRISAPTSAADVFCTPTYDTMVQWAPILGTDSGWLGLVSYGGVFDMDVSAATEGDCIVTGKAPHGALNIQFGDPMNPAEWYDVTKLNQLRLDVTAGSSASGTCEIFLEQVRNY